MFALPVYVDEMRGDFPQHRGIYRIAVHSDVAATVLPVFSRNYNLLVRIEIHIAKDSLYLFAAAENRAHRTLVFAVADHAFVCLCAEDKIDAVKNDRFT